MTDQPSAQLYRCILDGYYFKDKRTALIHLKIYHGYKNPDLSLLREVKFRARETSKHR